ncbi:hypothetical protein [Trinickia dinghuensis]|uniref:Uncharacterized protein n=1 Tax=Trinickia dinghuensis TaxID=2291023 RepID=A0A3D8JRN6_9BURK|nr:hypothetical protein [Trinickia dinghuensis]RDU95783.1 hypothetical protein DWV00_26335 [Trinickia dinghuensis]
MSDLSARGNGSAGTLAFRIIDDLAPDSGFRRDVVEFITVITVTTASTAPGRIGGENRASHAATHIMVFHNM